MMKVIANGSIFGVSIVFFLLMTIPTGLRVLAQQPSLDLGPDNQVKVSRLAPDAVTAQKAFWVSGGTKVRIHIFATSAGVVPSVLCANSQTVNAGNVSGIGGTFDSYSITPSAAGMFPTPDFAPGFHLTFEFPIQGTGEYIVSYNAPPNNQQEIAVITDLTTDSPVTGKLVTSGNTVTKGKPIALFVALFNGQSPVTNASITAEISLPDGTTVQRTFTNDGVGADYEANDGLYGSYYIPTQTGEHTVVAEMTGTTSANIPFTVTATASFWTNPNLARLTGEVDDFGVDENSDALLDKIAIRTEVETLVAGEFGVSVQLKTANGQRLVKNGRVQLPTPGLNHIDTDFDAESLLALGENGPYVIERIELVKHEENNSILLDTLEDLGETQAYQTLQLQRPPIVFTGVNQIETPDLNGNGKSDILNIKTGINVTRAGNYLFGGTLYDQNNQRIGSFNSQANLSSGVNNISFVWSGNALYLHGVSGVYKLRNVFVRELIPTDTEVYTGAALSVASLLQTPTYDFNQFDSGLTHLALLGNHSATGLDANSNGKYEVLRVRTELYALNAGSYMLHASVRGPSGNVLQTISTTLTLYSGVNGVQLDFGGGFIAAAPFDGPLTIGDVSVSTLSVPVLFTTQSFNSNQFETGLEFTGPNSAVGIDENLNGKYEKLRVQTTLFSGHASPFSLSATLKDGTGNTIQTTYGYQNLVAGTNVLQFDFDGSNIVNANVNGPLTVSVSVVGTNATLDVANLFSTQSFNSNQFEVGLEFTGQNSAQGIDANQNGLFESLKVQTQLNVQNAGSYSIQVSLLAPDGSTIQTIARIQTLTSGYNLLEFSFSGSLIKNANVNGPLTVGNVSVSGLGRSIQVANLFTTQSFSSSQFEILFEFVGGYTANGIDLNANGKFDRLRFQGSINVLVSGSYAVVAILRDSSGNQITYSGLYFNFVAGINSFTLDLLGSPIFNSHVNGPYRISLQAWDNPAQTSFVSVDNAFQTAAFNYTEFDQTLGFTGQNTAVGIDTNANGKFESLRITSGIMIEVVGYYNISVALKDSSGAIIRTITYQSTLQQGANTLTFDFEGVTIFNHGVDGPYTLGNASVTRQVNPSDGFTAPTVFTTPPFTIDQFEPGVADLHFVSYRLVPTTGDGDDVLEPGETANLYVTLSNHDTGVARNTLGVLTSVSPNVEILSGAIFGTLAVVEKEGTPFSIRMKPDAPYGAAIPFSLEIGYNTSAVTERTFSIQTGKLNRLLYNQVVQSRNQVFLMNSDGSNRTNLSNNSFNDYEPISAPNGSKVAFTRLISGTTSELWIMNNDGSGQQKLTDLYRFSGVDPTWSPDSTKIAFLTKVNNVVDLFVINVDGTGLARITNTPGQESYVAWSSTNKIAYTTNFGEDVHVVNPDGTGDTLIHDNPTNDLFIYDLSWSPDGSWIGWINERKVTQPTHYYPEVYISRPNGTEKRSLTTNAEAKRFVWSPDSSRIAYVHSTGSSTPEKIIVIDISSGEATDLSSFTNTAVYQFRVEVGSGDPKWSPDGRSIAFVGRETVAYTLGVSQYSLFLIDAVTGATNKVTLGITSGVSKPEWENLDRIPPASVISMTPTPNTNAWNTSDVTVGIIATDNANGSGVQNITYSGSGAQTIGSTTLNGSTGTVNIFGEGVTSFAYSAKDNRNNSEDLKTLAVKIDKSLPVSSHSVSDSGSQTTFSLTAADAVSGVSEIKYTIDGGSQQTYTAPFAVSNTGGHVVSYFARDIAGNEETPRAVYVNPASVAKSVLISEFRSRGNLGADDEFIELYNNSDTSIDISGWSLSVKHGSVSTPIALATINSGVTLPARGHYLLRKAGTTNYSLAGYAEADQTYTDSLGDNCGIKLVSGSGVTTDAVGFASVTDTTYREGTGITPSAGISTSGQYSFARNFIKQLPVDSNNNKVDFIFVATDGGTYNNLKAVLGSPAPENLASSTYREGNVLITQIDTKVTLAEAPNRVFNYTNPPPQYPVGVLSVRRKLTNNSGQTISQLKLRITTITTKNSPVFFPQQSQLRLFNSSDISVTSGDGQTTIPLRGLAVETVPTAGDGGFNSSFTLDLGPTGLAAGQSLNIDLKAGIVTNGQYKLEFRVEALKVEP